MENAGDAEVEEDTFVAGEEGLKGKRSRGVRGMSERTMVVVNERMEKWNSLGRSVQLSWVLIRRLLNTFRR